jgi:hypothetical protein
MNKRAMILLLICFVLAAATVTLRYIESEKEKIKAQFVPPPQLEPKRVRSITTTAYLPQEQPGGEEEIPAGEQPGAVPPLQNGKMLPEEQLAAPQEETLTIIEPGSQAVEQGEQQEASVPVMKEEEGAQEREIVVEEAIVTPLEEEVPVPPEAEESVEEDETDAEPEEDVADEREESDDEGEKEVDSDDEENVPPEPESEITTGKDEQVPPEEVVEEGEMEEGEYIEGEEEGEPFEDVLEDQAGEMLGEEEEIILFEEEEFPLDEENVLGEDEEIFLEEEE